MGTFYSNEVELLSPARDLETGLAAINCGADAVYLGAPRFGARESAGNDLRVIDQLASYAHKYWARVYVTVNTLLRDSEVPEAVELIHQLYGLGVDAVIIQDIGLLECDLPPIPLFASTQMHNHTVERISFLEKIGLQRVILARELSIEQIRSIRSQTHIELETFIHGALCVSYSGQCYMSYSMGGRSGNRGQCAQPCRLRYSLEDGLGQTLVKDRHILSLKDLNLSDHLGELLAAGVTSFKIEGRLKDKAYVMNNVAHYRRLLDRVIKDGTWKKSSSGQSKPGFIPEPLKTFNRGFSDYFFNGRSAAIVSPDTSKALGEPLGKVISVSPQSFEVDKQIEIHPGDGLCFLDDQRNLRGTVVNQVSGRWITPNNMEGMAKGTQIFRNHDHEFLSLLEKSKPERKIAVHIQVNETDNGFMVVTSDEDGNMGSVEIQTSKEFAQKPEQARENIIKQLCKLGATEFAADQVQINFSRPYFLPLSLINELRRQAVDELVQDRRSKRPVLEGCILRNTVPFPERELSFNGNVLNRKAAAFYYRHGVSSIEPAAESGLNLHGRKVMTTKLCLKYQLGACTKQKRTQKLNEPLVLVNEQGQRFSLRFNCKDCEMEILLEKEA